MIHFVGKTDLQKRKDRLREKDDPSSRSLPRGPQWTKLGFSKTRNAELHPVPHMAAECLGGQLPLLSRTHEQETALEGEQLKQMSIWDASTMGRNLAYCDTSPKIYI